MYAHDFDHFFLRVAPPNGPIKMMFWFPFSYCACDFCDQVTNIFSLKSRICIVLTSKCDREIFWKCCESMQAMPMLASQLEKVIFLKNTK